MKAAGTRRWGMRALCVLLGLAAALGISEFIFRRCKPTPDVQIVAARKDLDFWVEGGVPLWRERERREQANESCPRLHPAAVRIEIFGPSIFWGIGMAGNEPSFSVRLQKKLDDAAPGAFCVMNFSQPGFHSAQSAALAQKLIPRHSPALVFWSVWSSDPFPFSVLGDRAYDLSRLPVGSDGYPRALPLPALVNRVLFRHSRLYEYTTLQLLHGRRLHQPDIRPFWEYFAQNDLREIVQLSRRSGATLVPVFCPRLDRPFAEWASAPDASFYVPEVEAAIRRERLPEIRLGDALAGQDYRRLRLDECCHYNIDGHRALADVFFRWIMDHSALLKRPQPARL